MFAIKNLKFKDILSIDELTIKEKITTSIIGESGVGKSTFLKLLNHLNSYDDGEILYNNTPLHTMDPIELRRSVTMLSQAPAIFEGTVKENLTIALQFAEKEPVSDSSLKEALKIVHLDKSLDMDALNLSGGEQQRLAFARMVILDPPIILLDEPTSSLDSDTADLVMQNFLNWAKEREKTIIMVTHSKEIAEKYSDEIIKMLPKSNPEVIEQ